MLSCHVPLVFKHLDPYLGLLLGEDATALLLKTTRAFHFARHISGIGFQSIVAEVLHLLSRT